MLLKLDSRNLHLELSVGVLERYEPSKEIEDLYNKTQELKIKTVNFLKDTFGNIPESEIQVKMKKSAKLRKAWKQYLEEVYNPELILIINEVKEINKKICPNFPIDPK